MQIHNWDYMKKIVNPPAKKYRVIQRNGVFIPQQYRKTSYQNAWVGFTASGGYGTPLIKFDSEKLAVDFIDLVNRSLKSFKENPAIQVVYER